MEDTRGAVYVVLHGPAAEFDAVLAKIQAAGIFAKRDTHERDAISVFFHDGSDNPSTEFINQCVDRVRQLVERTGFKAGEPGVWMSNAASRQLPYDRRTGEWLGEFVDGEAPLAFREEQLQSLASHRGISVNDIELRDYLTPPSV